MSPAILFILPCQFWWWWWWWWWWWFLFGLSSGSSCSSPLPFPFCCPLLPKPVGVSPVSCLLQGGAGVPRTPKALGDRQPSLRRRSLGGASGGAFDEEMDSVEALQEELAIMREEQVLLMEAYEALENDVGKEIDKALEEQAGKAEETTGRLRVTEEELKAQYKLVAELQEQVGTLEERAEEAEAQAERFLSGNYGLGDAVHDVKTLKERLKADQLDMEKKVTSLPSVLLSLPFPSLPSFLLSLPFPSLPFPPCPSRTPSPPPIPSRHSPRPCHQTTPRQIQQRLPPLASSRWTR